MPRKSAEALAVVPATVTRLERVRPPKSLSPAQAAHFASLVAAKPAAYFQTADVPLLVELVRHLDRADMVERQFRKAMSEEMDAEEFGIYAKLAERETSLIASLMTKLRLTPQARYRPDLAKTHGTDGAKPWEFGEGPPGVGAN